MAKSFRICGRMGPREWSVYGQLRLFGYKYFEFPLGTITTVLQMAQAKARFGQLWPWLWQIWAPELPKVRTNQSVGSCRNSNVNTGRRFRSRHTQLRDGLFRNSIIYLETRDTAPHMIYSLVLKGGDINQCFATRAPQMQATFSKPNNSRVGQFGRLSRSIQESFNSYRMVVLRNTGA